MRMQKKRWFRLFGMDFLSSRKVIHMNTPERGAYLQLLMLAWDDPDCSLPNNLQELKLMAGWTCEQWGSFAKVRACLTKHPTVKGRLYNPRLYDEFLYCQHRSQSASKSVHERWDRIAQPPKPAPVARQPQPRGTGFESAGSIADKHFKPI